MVVLHEVAEVRGRASTGAAHLMSTHACFHQGSAAAVASPSEQARHPAWPQSCLASLAGPLHLPRPLPLPAATGRVSLLTGGADGVRIFQATHSQGTNSVVLAQSASAAPPASHTGCACLPACLQVESQRGGALPHRLLLALRRAMVDTQPANLSAAAGARRMIWSLATLAVQAAKALDRVRRADASCGPAATCS